MKYVIIRDDDTNALMPIECLERLFRPFLDRGLPVNLATIPNVRSDVKYPDGRYELFLMAKPENAPLKVPLGENRKLVDYIKSNPGYHVVQHGCHHDFVQSHYEFDHDDRTDITRRLDEGARHLMDAGFEKPTTFVAPYDQLSRTSLEEVSRRFRVLSTGWYQLGRLPVSWWPGYIGKKLRQQPHWQVGQTLLLTHPGCHLSYHRPYESMLDEIKRSIESRRVTVLVSHWWEYFRDGKPDEPFIQVLHETADYLASNREVRVIKFEDLVHQQLSLN